MDAPRTQPLPRHLLSGFGFRVSGFRSARYAAKLEKNGKLGNWGRNILIGEIVGAISIIGGRFQALQWTRLGRDRIHDTCSRVSGFGFRVRALCKQVSHRKTANWGNWSRFFPLLVIISTFGVHLRSARCAAKLETRTRQVGKLGPFISTCKKPLALDFS